MLGQGTVNAKNEGVSPRKRPQKLSPVLQSGKAMVKSKSTPLFPADRRSALFAAAGRSA